MQPDTTTRELLTRDLGATTCGELDDYLATLAVGQVAGVDEAGRGPLAGPCVAAAVIFTGARPDGLDDSKRLSVKVREKLYGEIMSNHQVGVSVIDAARIDEVGIGVANRDAMQQAVDALEVRPDLILVDGYRWELTYQDGPAVCWQVVKGDRRSAAVAAASIVAKVTRDRMMVDADRQWPRYGFATHKGYGTAAHMAALTSFGPCPEHRHSFRPVATAAREHESRDAS